MSNNLEIIKQIFFNSLEDSLVILKFLHEQNEKFSSEQRDQIKKIVTILMSEVLTEERSIVHV